MEKRTTKPEYIEPLLTALGRIGSASEDDLLDAAFKLMKNKLYQVDYVMMPGGLPRWRYQMQHMLDGLIDSGKIVKKEGLLILGKP